MRVAYVYFFIMYAMCPLHYFLKARYDLLVRFLLREFTCILEDPRSRKNRRRASREREATRRCLHARCILVRVITLTKRRIAW